MTPPGMPLRQMLMLLYVDHLVPVYSSIDEACEPLAGRRHPLPPHPAARRPDQAGPAVPRQGRQARRVRSV